MRSSILSTTKQLIKKYRIQPLKKLGQNFLIDENIVKKIINTADIKKTDYVLEIGPGLGIITKYIAPFCKKTIIVEKDKNLCQILKQELKDFKNIEIINNDILKTKLNLSKLKIIGNIPFYLTSHLIRKLLEDKNKPKEMIFIIQKEVAQRICSNPPKMNFLAVIVQFWAKPEIISYISKKSFLPRPKVDCAIIKITPHKKKVSSDFYNNFLKIISFGFSQPRKYLINNFSKKLKLNKKEAKKWLLKNNIGPTKRAEALALNDWINIALSAPN